LTVIWDQKTDAVKKGDSLRKVIPIKVIDDAEGSTIYVFKSKMFKNPWYTIPDDELELFNKFVMGGSREYPSDGNIPCDVVAGEVRKVLNLIMECSADPNHVYCNEAREALRHGKKALVRGTLKLYLGKYTTRDWRRKRFTDDIDFWTRNINLLEYSLKNCRFIKNKETGEWEKLVKWFNPFTKEERTQKLFAANNLNQVLDFGGGSYLEGSELKDIFSKKIKRGHDVDISDMINVALVHHGVKTEHEKEWGGALKALEEAANTRNSRTTANLISLSQYSSGIANHLQRIARALIKYNDLILDEKRFDEDKIKDICRISIHWERFHEEHGLKETRSMLHEFYHEQAVEKEQHAKNLRNFSKWVLDLLNSKYKHLKIKFRVID